jgi:cell division septum initiation protein DivIVA
MDIKEILTKTYNTFSGWRKSNLVTALINLREKYLQLQDRVRRLEQENKRLKEELEQEKIRTVNKRVNQPSSKQPEWDKDSNSNEDKDQKRRRGRKRKPRKGAGNRPKNQVPNHQETVTVDKCDLCGKDLSDQAPLESINERIIEDIVAPPEETVVTLVTQQKKYCADCQEVTTARSDLALPKADIGLNATVLVCYLWVALCLPYTKIMEYLGTFFKLSVSTSGLSRHLIRVAGIMKDVHVEILESIQHGAVLHADETGWRVRGRNWWLWVFGTPDTAYFTVDKTRGSAVVRRVLGEIFFGVLVVDGWSAYVYLLCEQQSCLAHLLRKVRKFRDAFPQLTDIVKFYLKFRRIIRDGERLQKNRDKLGELVFRRRLKRLKQRLADLLQWPNPDEILKEIIKKVKRQQPRILTFVEHPDVPFHNNYAEYLIRIGVLKRKISGGSVSAEGAESYSILLSIYVTCKLRGISPKYLKESLKHYIKTGKPLLLKSYQNVTEVVPRAKKTA